MCPNSVGVLPISQRDGIQCVNCQLQGLVVYSMSTAAVSGLTQIFNHCKLKDKTAFGFPLVKSWPPILTHRAISEALLLWFWAQLAAPEGFFPLKFDLMLWCMICGLIKSKLSFTQDSCLVSSGLTCQW